MNKSSHQKTKNSNRFLNFTILLNVALILILVTLLTTFFMTQKKDKPLGEIKFSVTPTVTPMNTNVNDIVCTQEAKQCPDGSYVGRTGSNCEFTPCPK